MTLQTCPLMPLEQIKDVCILLRDYLPQPGALSERKYTLRSTQEEELEHALRILDGALYRNLDSIAVDKAKRTLKRLTPVIQVRTDAITFKNARFLIYRYPLVATLCHTSIPPGGRASQSRASSTQGGTRACPRAARHPRVRDQNGAAAS